MSSDKSYVDKPSQAPSIGFAEAHKCTCNFVGSIADHLRASKECLQNLRKKSLLQRTSDEEFIVKMTLFWGGCPAIGCSGRHKEIPDQCLQWWMQYGWDLMQFRGSSSSATDTVIRKKISMFLRNMRRRLQFTEEGEDNDNIQNLSLQVPGEILDRRRKDGGRGQLNLADQQCQFCKYTGPLAKHFHEAKPCLKAYTQNVLLGERENVRLAIFDLGLLLSFCPNPTCNSQTYIGDEVQHSLGPCQSFLLREAEAIFNWTDVCMDNLLNKMNRRKKYVKTLQKQMALRGLNSFRSELQDMLTNKCSSCCIRGPLFKAKEHDLHPVFLHNGGEGWLCTMCKESQGGFDGQDALQTMRILGGALATEDDTLKAVRVGNMESGTGHIVFVPAPLAGDLPIEDNIANLQDPSSTVLVPFSPGAIDDIGDNAFKRAWEERSGLKKWAQFCTLRPFVNEPTIPLTILYRYKLVEIQHERLNMLKSMTETGKGEVLSKNPNRANIKERNPHFDVTKKFGLTKTCRWSDAYWEKRQDESVARSSFGGQVKTKVRISILEKVAHNNLELQRVLLDLFRGHMAEGVLPVLPTVTIVLQHMNGKVKLLLEHIISPNYTNWDLDIDFKQLDWTAELVGFLYSQEYDNINMKIARDGASPQEIMDSVIQHPEKMPTVSLCQTWIMDHFSLKQEEAEVICN